MTRRRGSHPAPFLLPAKGDGMSIRGVRGAVTVDADTTAAILDATSELLQTLISANGIEEEDVASILFTTTHDLTACYPARAARDLGWTQVALMGFQEMDVPEGLKMCIRILLHWNTDKPQKDVIHVFLRGAVVLRPDLASENQQS
jgi:chorismate mutase